MGWICRWVRPSLSRVAAGVVFRPLRALVHWHLVRCPDCSRLWSQHETITEWLLEAAKERAVPPPDLWVRIVSRLEPRPHPVPRRPFQLPRLAWAMGIALFLLTMLLWFRPRPRPSPSVPLSPPDAFMTALLHQHLSITAEVPFHDPTFTAVLVLTAGEGQ